MYCISYPCCGSSSDGREFLALEEHNWKDIFFFLAIASKVLKKIQGIAICRYYIFLLFRNWWILKYDFPLIIKVLSNFISNKRQIQINLCQKNLFLDQLTHNMTKYCLLIYQFSTWKLQAQNLRRSCSEQKLFFVFVLTFKTIFAHNKLSPWSELAVFMYWTSK